MYPRWVAWAGVITLAIAVVCERVRLEMGSVAGVFFTLGGGWSAVWGNLNLVCHATGSYLLVLDGSGIVIGEALGFVMATFGGLSRGRSSWGWRMGRSV